MFQEADLLQDFLRKASIRKKRKSARRLTRQNKRLSQKMASNKTPPCNRGCGQRVWFDWSAKAGDPGRSDFGKLRPLQVSSEGECLNEIHECPNSDWNKKQQQRTNGGAKVGNVQIEAVLGNTMDIIARLEKLEKKFDDMTKVFMNVQIGQKNLDPLNDDGDSMRENPEIDK